MLWVSCFSTVLKDFLLFLGMHGCFNKSLFKLQVDQRWAVPCAWHDEWCGEHTEQEWRGKGQNRASRRIFVPSLVHSLESLQVSHPL